MCSKEQTEFFRAEVFRVLARELHRRYYLNEDFGQSVSLKKFQGIDTEPLRSLLGYTLLAWSKKKKVAVAEIEEALRNSALDWSLKQYVEFATGKSLLVKRKVEAEKALAYQLFMQRLNGIDAIFNQLLTAKQLKNWFAEADFEDEVFRQTALAIHQLPQTEYLRMPVFAYQITGNPHAFDEDRPAGKLLIQLLSAQSKQDFSNDLARVEMKNQLLAEFHLLRDDMMSYAAIRGLTAQSNGQENGMWHQACLENCSWNVPLKEILRMEEIYPLQGSKVLVVENSGIYSILVDLLSEVPIVCSSGQFTYAIWQLLRKLNRSQTQLYYVGDLDPEGLLMAQRLLEMFPEHMQTIAMNLQTFAKAKTAAVLSPNRLKQMGKLRDPKLRLIADEIKMSGCTAMQEGFIEELIDEVEWEFL